VAPKERIHWLAHWDRQSYRTPNVSSATRFLTSLFLERPDSQAMGAEADQYAAFVEGCSALEMAEAKNGVAYLLSLAGKWLKCSVTQAGRALWLMHVAGVIEGGMSGSPILDGAGRVIGVCAAGGKIEGGIADQSGPEPRLTHHLPGWLLRQITG